MSDKCTVREGKFVEPCDTLREAAEVGSPPSGKQRGLYWWQLSNLNTHKPTRSFFAIKTSSHPKGLALNVCPWCGERIDAPFADD